MLIYTENKQPVKFCLLQKIKTGPASQKYNYYGKLLI